jgi:hypothetical protein
MRNKNYKLGIFYGNESKTKKLADRFIGHLINDIKFCIVCDDSERRLSCSQCRKYLRCNSNNIYFYEAINDDLNGNLINTMLFKIPLVDFLLVIGIDKNLLSKFPKILRNTNIKAVIIPIENSNWISPELQLNLLSKFEKYKIQAAFPKPFCSLSKEENQYNRKGFHTTENRNYIDEFIDYFKIGVPIISFLMTDDRKTVEDAFIMQSAPCGSTYYIIQQLKSRNINRRDGETRVLIEEINRAHNLYPCYASKDKDYFLENSIFKTSSQILRNIVRCELYLAENKICEQSMKLEEILRKQRMFSQI